MQKNEFLNHFIHVHVYILIYRINNKEKNITNVINKLKYISTKCFAKENTAKQLIYMYEKHVIISKHIINFNFFSFWPLQINKVPG